MKRSLITIASCLLALFMLFVSTDPGEIPPFLLIAPFILLFITMYMAISSVLAMKGVVLKKRRSVAIMVTSFPVLLLILQSIGQLTIRDVATTGAVFLLAYFYVSRMVANHSEQ